MENEGLPPLVENRTPRYVIQFIYILAITLLLGGACQFIGVSVCSMVYSLDVAQLEGILSGTTTGSQYHGALYILLAFNALSFLAPALAIPRLIRENPREFLQVNNWARPRMYILAAALLLVSQPLISLLVEWNKDLFDISGFSSYKTDVEAREKQVEAIFTPLLQKGGIVFFLLNLLIFALLPAISEEFLFRGVIQKHFYNWTGKIHLAVFLAAAIFSIFHLQWMILRQAITN